MLQKLNKKNKGFTLVEIMIVVAIIALLSAIAVPNFLRARKRSQATRVLEDLRLVEAAKDQWALEKNKKGSDTVLPNDLKGYFKPGSHIITPPAGTDPVAGAEEGEVSALYDTIGNEIALVDVNTPAKVDEDTVDEFLSILGDDATADGDEAKAFWGVYHPAATTGGGTEGDDD